MKPSSQEGFGQLSMSNIKLEEPDLQVLFNTSYLKQIPVSELRASPFSNIPIIFKLSKTIIFLCGIIPVSTAGMSMLPTNGQELRNGEGKLKSVPSSPRISLQATKAHFQSIVTFEALFGMWGLF